MSTHERWFLVTLLALFGLGLQQPAPAAQEPAPAEEPAPEVQAVPRMVELPITWQVGDRLEVAMEKTRQKSEGHQVTMSGGSKTTAIVEVMQVDEKGARFAWTWGKTTLSTGEPENTAGLAHRLSNINAGLRLELQMDEFGSVISLANLDEVAVRTKQAIGLVEELMRAEGTSEEKLKAVMASVGGLMNRDVIAQTAVQDAAQFFMMSGGSFPEGEVIADTEKQPNLFGGPDMDVLVEIELSSYDEAVLEAIVELKQTFDSRQAAISIFATMQQMAAQAGREAPDESEMPSVSITDLVKWTYDMRTGWPKSCVSERKTQIGTRGQVDRSTFTSMPLPRVESK